MSRVGETISCSIGSMMDLSSDQLFLREGSHGVKSKGIVNPKKAPSII